MDQEVPHGHREAQQFDRKLKRQTRRSIFWTVTEAGAEQGFSFLIFVLMARTLPMAELATLAITFVFLDVGRIVAAAGIIQRIARAKALSASDCDTIFWTNLAMAAVYCLAVIAAAGWIGTQFDAPKLDQVLRWMTIALMLQALGNTHMGLRLREFGHSTLAKRTFFAGLLGGAAAVVLLLLGAGIWSFVGQRIVREAVATILSWASVAWRPRLTFDASVARQDLRFGADIGGARLVAYLIMRAQDLIIGRFLGPIALSTYRVAWRPTELLGPGLVSTHANVALQTFSRLQDSPSELRLAYRALLRHCAFISVPAMVGYGVAGPWLVPALFGPAWHASGWIAPALMPLAIPFTVSLFALALLTAVGRSAWLRRLAIAELVTTLLFAAAALRFGLVWVALSYSLRAYAWLPVQLRLVRKVTPIGLRDHLSALWPPLVASAIMAAAVGSALYLTDPRGLIAIAMICAVGAALYAGVLLALLPDERRNLAALLNGLRASSEG